MEGKEFKTDLADLSLVERVLDALIQEREERRKTERG